ncbi:TetR/AcrR family transcriptional regulator [Ktedonospora formicarum]|uniref:TetR family transcriptional regulator n=1 Tax=Ktedonospora formicarum TaxID=2778364 RepID=A0A8J3I7W2_9CHLR|nr:TetR/AcrR family transcriptional regulator [Ktedonospora formicarum]GHO47433.1 TetR family transcriptional regulator [Ktedonospora formicarum]
MPYPAKTNARTILQAAIEYLEQYGEEALSMRELASRLGLTPRALYRYYPDRAALEATIAEEGFRRLHADLVVAVGKRVGKDALRVSAVAYLTFAQAHPTWYALLMRFHVQSPGLLEAGHQVWTFVVGLAEDVVGVESAASAAVAFWAFLHGFTQLERAAILSEQKPRSGFQVGLEAFLSGFTTLSSNPSL